MSTSEYRAFLILLATTAALAWLAVPLGWDESLATLTYDAQSGRFPLRESWLFRTLLHDGLHWAPILVALTLVTLSLQPAKVIHPEDRRALRYALLVLVVGTGACALLKDVTPMICPWADRQFGGTALRVTLLDAVRGLVPAGTGPGHCWPSGHAAGGFSLLGLYVAARVRRPRLAPAVLVGVLALGTLMGIAQLLRGAHFLSHVLWAAFICGGAALALSPLAAPRLEQGQPQPSPRSSV